jgi:hypothetical protein
MKSTCQICQKEFEYEPLPDFMGIDTSDLRIEMCSDDCYYQWKDQIATLANYNLLVTILKVMPEVYLNIAQTDFQNMPLIHVKSEKPAVAEKIVVRFANSDYWSITFSSPTTGIGKTRLGLYTLARLAKQGVYRTRDVHTIQDAGYFSALEIAKSLKTESYDKKQFQMRNYCRSRVLMIDDLGQENKRDSGELAGIIKIREEKSLKTIITTNLTPHELEERYSDRVKSRIIRGMFEVKGEDKRQ